MAVSKYRTFQLLHPLNTAVTEHAMHTDHPHIRRHTHGCTQHTYVATHTQAEHEHVVTNAGGESTHPVQLSCLLRFLDHMVAYLLMRGDSREVGGAG